MEHVRTVTREFRTGEQAVLHLEARSGSVVVEGRETDTVSVDAVVHIWTDLSSEADDAATLVERAMEQDAHRVIIRTPPLQHREGWGAIFHQKFGSVDYHVRVPVNSAVRVLSRSGNVQITHIEGVVHTEALSGKIGVHDIGSDVTVRSRSGSALVENARGDVVIEARSGKVRARDIGGNAQVEARSGSLELENVAGDARVTASSGSVAVHDVLGRLHVRARAGSVRYRGRVLADVDIDAQAGSISFACDPAHPFFIEAESHLGSVKSDLAPKRGGGNAPSADAPRVKLRTRAGSIRITRSD